MTMAVVIENGDVVVWQFVWCFIKVHLNEGGSSVERMWRVSEVQAVASLTSRVKTLHVPSMFAV